MPIAAVPNYLGKDFKDASPGLRFGMYLKLWGINRHSGELLWSTHDIDYEVRGQQQQKREVKYENKVSALSDARRLNVNDQKTMKALLARQQQAFVASTTSATSLRLEAVAIAPFTTGLGNEHPLENGFAFLNPYGLPYLPGGGVKGVLRQAARELASGEWDDARGWSSEARYAIGIGSGRNRHTLKLSMLDVLFGHETAGGDTDHVRGALTFWDVIPQIKGDSLAVDIMTPHQSHYYQWKKDVRGNPIEVAPHESGQPNPISFLTVPPGSGFVFHVQCDAEHLTRLAPELAEAGHDGKALWQTLIEAAFAHAFQWLGFGAKTAVGYGAMRRDLEAEKKAAEKIARVKADAQKAREEEARAAQRQAELAQLSPLERELREFLDARPDKNQSELSALLSALKQGKWQGNDKIEIARQAERLMRGANKWKEKSEKKKPEKDHDYQDTLRVMAWLRGEP
jgi:CRISPR-associated protein Cmr6